MQFKLKLKYALLVLVSSPSSPPSIASAVPSRHHLGEPTYFYVLLKNLVLCDRCIVLLYNFLTCMIIFFMYSAMVLNKIQDLAQTLRSLRFGTPNFVCVWSIRSCVEFLDYLQIKFLDYLQINKLVRLIIRMGHKS